MDYNLNIIFSVLSITAAIISLGGGIFVSLRNPRHPSNTGFFLGMLSLFLVEAGNALFLLSDSSDPVMFMLGKKISLTGEFFLPSTWFLFTLSFSRSNYKEVIIRWRSALISLCIGSLVSVVAIWSNLVFLPLKEESNKLIILHPWGRYFYIFLLLGMMINIIHLENTLRYSNGIKRQHIKYVIIGVGAILGYYIYLSSEVLLFSSLDLLHIPVTAIVTLISSSLIIFALVRYHLLDVNIFVSRYIIFNSLTILIAGLYLLAVGLGVQVIKLWGGDFNRLWIPLFTFVALMGLVVILLSSRLRRKMQVFVATHFYRHKYEFRDKWMETIERIGKRLDLGEIQKGIVEMISETMGAREVYLWVKASGNEYIHVASTIDRTGWLDLKEEHPLVRYIRDHSEPFFIQDLISGGDKGNNILSEEAGAILRATKAVLCTPLITGDEIVGFILQGEDISGERYGKDDFDLLKAIASHAANVIKKIQLTQKIVEVKEAETFHQVSSFFIHDLKNFVSTLSILTQNAEENIGNPAFQQDALKTLRNIVGRMNTMISNLSLLSKGLHINPSRIDLNSLIEDTLLALNGQRSVKITRRFEPLPSLLADGEQVQKICLNLLLNAIEASPSDGEVEIKTYAMNGEVIFSVTDHGCGMSREFIKSSLFRPFQTTKPKGLGIGLFQCKKIVEAHKGRIEVESEEGKGSEFRVFLPIRMG